MINTKTFDDYQMSEYKNVQTLMEEMKKAGATSQSLYIEQGDDTRADFRLIYRHDAGLFLIRKDWKGYIDVFLYPYQRYTLDSYTLSNIRKEIYTSNKMKVISLKKINEKIAEELRYHEEATKLQNEASDKVAYFLKTLEDSGEDVRYSKNYEGTKITGGSIHKGGIYYTFEISDSGFISQNIRLSYSEPNNIETFKKLADNKL